MPWVEIKTVIIIFLLFLLPGWALLAVTGYWRRWNPLQRWFLAVCLGIAFWPVLCYTARAILPSVRIGDSKIALILVINAVLIVWKLRNGWKVHFKLEKWGWLALAILGLTLLTRLFIAYQNPYLAGDDGLHHVLLTEFTSARGVLPYTLEPYGATSLDHYHLGFYGLTAPLKLLANIGSDQAVLWMSQFLNGICGVGVFLVLDKKASRPAAIIGMLVAGLLSPYPSWFINWSRFTQLAAQTILLPAALVFWDAVSTEVNEGAFLKRVIRAPMIETVLLISAVCLTHFRVAGFLLPLMIVIFVYEYVIKRRPKNARLSSLVHTIAIGLLVIVLILPALIPGLNAYLDDRMPTAASEPSGKSLEDIAYYSEGDPTTMKVFWDSGWLLIVMAAGTLLALLRPKTRFLGILNLLWVAFLVLFAYAYKLDTYILTFTNITAVVLSFYLPISIGAGLLLESLRSFVPERNLSRVENLVMVLTIVAAVFFVPVRINDFEPQRAFMTPEDQIAMDWVRTNTPTTAYFAVNLNFLNPTTPFGTDAGYWLPYYADRQTTTLTLISGLDGKNLGYVERAQVSLAIYEDPVDVQKLCDNGITHLYSGVKPPFGSPDLADNINGTSGVNLVYDQDGVEIYQICGK